MIKAFEEFVLAMPEEFESKLDPAFKEALIQAMVQLQMAQDGLAKITGHEIKNGFVRIIAENTPVGRQVYLDARTKALEYAIRKLS